MSTMKGAMLGLAAGGLLVALIGVLGVILSGSGKTRITAIDLTASHALIVGTALAIAGAAATVLLPNV